MKQYLVKSPENLSQAYLGNGVRAAAMAFLTCCALFIFLLTFKFGIIL
ncbi:hypothetical protein [Mesorhizobium caraganae]|nr:hypothetical protein [Mesorhizobium caraganae]